MTTQQQAYINGFVKRASEYGYSEDQAVNILKKASNLGFLRDSLISLKNRVGDHFNDVKGLMESQAYNNNVDKLTQLGVPHHIADYGMKTMGSDAVNKGIMEAFNNKYDSDVFGAEHPILSGALNKTKDWLSEHNFDPDTGALALGGAGLLGGGYLLGKHLNKKKEQKEYPQY